MDLRQLSYFVRVIEVRSFTKAAEVLRISQPAIGEQIKNLEAELGATLLIRHSRGVDPTETGRLLFNKARAILLQVEEARTSVREYEKGLRGEVTVGLTPGLGEFVAADAIERCARDFPGVSVNVVEDISTSLVKRIAANEPLSFAIVSGYELATTGNIDSIRLFEEELCAVGHPKVLGRADEPIQFGELAQFRLILLGNGSVVQHGLKAQLANLARSENVEISIAYEIQAMSVVKQLIEREVGVAILPFAAVRNRVEEGRLTARRVSSPAITRELNLIWNTSHALSAAEQTVRDLMVELVIQRRSEVD